tara:strand:- start:11646 stop:12071 length:426 start_codon:yes stop_codon:yes gene_type:complete
MTNLENLLKERQKLIKESYSSEDEYMYFLKKEGFHFLFFRNLKQNEYDKEFYFFKFLDNKIHFISFINYKFPRYNSFNFEDIVFIKVYTDTLKVILRNDKTFYVGSKNDSVNSEDEVKIASQIICKIFSKIQKNNKVILNL